MRRQAPRLVPMVLLLGLCLPAAAGGDPIVLNGQLIHRTDDSGANSSLQQTYNLDLLKYLQVNERMDLTTAVRYSREQREEEIQDTIVPTFTWDIHTDLHNLRVTASTNEQLSNDEADRSYRSWEALWRGGWLADRYIPAVQVRFNQNWNLDHETPRSEDNRHREVWSNLDWDWKPFRAYYAFTGEKSEDDIANGEVRSMEHQARGEYAQNFLDDRLRVGLTHQFDTRTQDTAIGPSGETEELLVKVPVVQAGSGFDDTPEQDPLAPNGKLIDNLLREAAVTLDNQLLASDLLNIGVRLDLAKVDVLYLYTVEDISADAGFFVWDIYESSDGSIWTPRGQRVAASYQAGRRRFSLDVGGPRSRHLKVVARLAPAKKIDFSEVEVYERFEVAGGGVSLSLSRRQTSHISGANVMYSVRPDLQLAYNLNYERSDYSEGMLSVVNNNAASLRWIPMEQLITTIHSGISTQSTTGAEDTSSRYYGINVAYPPIPTVNLASSLVFNEQYEGDRKKSDGASLAINLQSVVYRDLSASLNTGYDVSEDYVSGVTQEDLVNQVIVTSRLIPQLLTDLDVIHRQDLAGILSDAVETKLNLHWRPSELFNMRFSIFDERGRDENTLYSLAGNFAPTPKLQFFTTFNQLSGSQSGRLVDLGLSWPLSPYLSFSSIGSFLTDNDGRDSWKLFFQLNASYMGVYR